MGVDDGIYHTLQTISNLQTKITRLIFTNNFKLLIDKIKDVIIKEKCPESGHPMNIFDRKYTGTFLCSPKFTR